MLPFRWQLARRGYRVYQPRLSPLCIQDVRKLAGQLHDAVEQVCADCGEEQVDVVGVSQGGIIGLYYLLHGGGVGRIRRLVTVGSPVQGSYAAVGGLPVLGPISKGIRQLYPGAPFLAELATPTPAGVRVSTLSVMGDTYHLPQDVRFGPPMKIG